MKFLYCRVSSVYQNTDRQTLDEKGFDRVYIDKCSGKDRNRPELEAMLSNLRPGDEITCHSLDRLARNLFDLQSLVKEIIDKDCSVMFVKENLRFEPGKDNAMSTLMLQILGSIAEFERALIKNRQAEGIAIAKARGKFKGGKNKLDDDDITELKELVRKKKMPITEVAEKFGLCRASVYNYMKKTEKDKK